VRAANVAAAPLAVRVAGAVTRFRTSRCRHAAPRRGSFLEWSLYSVMGVTPLLKSSWMLPFLGVADCRVPHI
jgi:hypothetical protein